MFPDFENNLIVFNLYIRYNEFPYYFNQILEYFMSTVRKALCCESSTHFHMSIPKC
jgi:hypothetical protein